jgi:4-aminobutyrate aminotransferase
MCRNSSACALIAAIEELFARQVDPRDVAAIFVEPIQGEGGYIVPPPQFLPALRALCDTHGILLVCDEIQCGVGRTGKMWATEFAGIEPDILLTAKGLASGMPLGAIIAKDSITKWENGAHGSTFGGNPVACAAAMATLDVVEQELLPKVPALGDRLIGAMRELQAKHPSIGDVRGKGLMIGVEFVKDRRTREPAPELLRSLVLGAFQRGLLLLGAGKSTLRLAPPLVVDEGDVDTALAIIDGLLSELD